MESNSEAENSTIEQMKPTIATPTSGHEPDFLEKGSMASQPESKHVSDGASGTRKREAPDESECYRKMKKSRESSQDAPESEVDIDQIWAQMNDIKPKDALSKEMPKRGHSGSDSTTAQTSVEKSLSHNTTSLRLFPRLAELEAKSDQDAKQQTQEILPDKKRTGLEQVLTHVRATNNNNNLREKGMEGLRGSTVLNSSRSSWSQFKNDEHIREELDGYKKDRKRYTDRAAFLARTDVRQWEFEQRGRKSRR